MVIETARIDVTAVFAVLSCSCNFNYPFRKYNNVINKYLRFNVLVHSCVLINILYKEYL